MRKIPLLLAAAGAALFGQTVRADGLTLYAYGSYRSASSVETASSGSSITGIKPAPGLDLLLSIPEGQDTRLEFMLSGSEHEFEPSGQGKLRARHLQFGGVKYVEYDQSKGSMYVGLMVGGSQVETPGTRDFQPSASLYGGYEWRPTANLGLRLEARLLGVFFDTDSYIVCDGGCRARIRSGVWSQGSLGLGVGWRF